MGKGREMMGNGSEIRRGENLRPRLPFCCPSTRPYYFVVPGSLPSFSFPCESLCERFHSHRSASAPAHGFAV